MGANQRMRAYNLYQQEFLPSLIHKQLQKEFTELEVVVSLRTVMRWVREFKTVAEEVRELDKPFEWHKLEEYGLPWEASAFLLEMSILVQENKIYRGYGFEPLAPTVRQARWWWRVHLAAPDLDPVDVWYLAQRFVSRELACDALGEPEGFADLEAQLSYKPWDGWPKDSENLEIYRHAVEIGRIPQLRSFGGRIPLVQYDKTESELVNLILEQTLAPDYPELLHSQQLKLMRERSQGTKKEIEREM